MVMRHEEKTAIKKKVRKIEYTIDGWMFSRTPHEQYQCFQYELENSILQVHGVWNSIEMKFNNMVKKLVRRKSTHIWLIHLGIVHAV